MAGELLLYPFHSIGIKTCTSGFPVSLETDDGGNTDTAVTILIPDMNFTCNATIAGFTFAGINRQGGHQDPVIQIWRESCSQPDTGATVYYKTGPAIAVNISQDTGACDDGLPDRASRIYWCILKRDFRASVEPGDILGLELPPTSDDDFDILFTEGGPVNYIFHQRLNSTIELSSHQTSKAQLPQITFSLTSGTDNCINFAIGILVMCKF